MSGAAAPGQDGPQGLGRTSPQRVTLSGKSLHGPHGTHCFSFFFFFFVDQAGLELRKFKPASAFLVLGLKAYVIMPDF